ncbi:MAG: enoyl-CoA hydratase/isomerase family protein [Rhodocyclaceae bacterium]|nr:enoyl-CoA hydratase/isomerase family protein [Rhodocyclaceae bacterium]
MYQTLEIEHGAGIATIWMNRPERHNAFNETLIAELDAAFAELDGDASVRVVVLAGRGNSFSAGADVNWMKTAGEASIADNHADAMRLARMLERIARCRKPTVARVHGAALGGGLGLACACDICVAGERAVFATSEVKFGLVPATIGPYVLRAIGERQALRYFQSAERIDAVHAVELGIAHQAVADDALDDAVLAQVSALLQGGPLAQAAAKDLIGAITLRPVDDALLADTARRIAELRATPEAREGLSAFLDKRRPDWQA